MSKKIKPQLTIAGPGAGKTHNMINQIIDCLPQIESHRYLAVITYTRAATNEIKERFQKQVNIPQNFFIGTIHSFLNNFILQPYGLIFNLVPENRIYVECEIETKSKDPKTKAIEKKRVVKSLLNQGIILYDEVINQSKILIKDKKIRSLVGHRLQVLFIDEYQDATVAQHEIFEEIRKEKRTQIYCVGDPEQYIMGFTYRGKKKPTYEKIPFFRMAAKSQVREIKENYRSNHSIVNFINNFNTNIEQKSISELVDKEVSFIKDTNLEKIISQFNDICDEHIFKEKIIKKYYLSYENKTFSKIASKYNLHADEITDNVSNDLFKNTVEFISQLLKKSKTKIMEDLDLDIIAFRSKCFTILHSITNSNFIDAEPIIDAICDLFEVRDSQLIKNSKKRTEEFLDTFKNSTREKFDNGHYMSIHKSKGLEADAVLVVAKNNKELEMWLETDKEKRFTDTTDKCRLGFVGFSRAKEVLCIACLEEISPVLKTKLLEFGVRIV